MEPSNPMTPLATGPASNLRPLLNKVPEATLFFWLIKIMCTTVGETFADYLNVTLNFGLKKTSIVMVVLLVGALAFQFRARRYIPSLYWTVVVLISVVGTLITDALTDKMGVPLQLTTVIFTVVLAGIFAVWYATERTLSIHSIDTVRREEFYWLAILFTFALGTASGDLFAEKLNLGYFVSFLIFGALIGIITVAHFRFKLNAVLAFWPSPRRIPGRPALPEAQARRSRAGDHGNQCTVPRHDPRPGRLPHRHAQGRHRGPTRVRGHLRGLSHSGGHGPPSEELLSSIRVLDKMARTKHSDA
jgi:uncharacterized membrane-anchored protein